MTLSSRIRLHGLLGCVLLFNLASTAQEIPLVNILQHPSPSYEHHCWDIAESCDGYIYAATAAGVSIYNGYEWQTVSLPFNRIARSLHLGKDCRVYVGAFETFGYIDHSPGYKPRYVPAGDSILQGTNEEIWRILGNESELVIQSFSDVYRFDYHQLVEIPMSTNIRLGSEANADVFIPRIDGGVEQLSNGHFQEVLPVTGVTAALKFSGIASGRSPNEIILATERSGLYSLTGDDLAPIYSPDMAVVASNQINDIVRLNSGSYAIGTILNGVYITDDLQTISFHINKHNGLATNTVLAMTEDANGDLWTGLDGGISVLRLSNPVRRYYDNDGLLGTIYSYTIFDGNLFLSTNHGVFQRSANGEFHFLPNSQGQAWQLKTIENQLFCGHNNGTYVYDGSELELVSDITGGWWMETINDSTILQATYTGLILLNNRQDSINAVRVTRGGILMRKFVLQDHTILGYHSRYGLCIAKLSEDYSTLESHELISHISGELVDPSVGMFSSGEKILVSWKDSVFVVDGMGLKPIGQESLQQLGAEDPTFATNMSVYAALMARGESFTLSILDHTRLAEVEPFIFSRDDGYLIGPLEPTPASLPVEVDNFVVNGQFLPKSSIQDLGPNQRNITVQLRNLAEKSDGRQVLYRLAPVDESWLPVPPDGKLAFRNLASGNYSLRIRDAFGNERLLESFNIPDPWHLSWPGGILYITLLITTVWFWNKRVERRTAEKARREHSEKVRALEAEQIRRNNDQLRREVQLKSKLLANRAMALAQKNKLLLQLREFVQSRQFSASNPEQFRAKIIRMVDQHTDHEDEWEVFESNFDEVHEKFTERLLENHPNLTSGDKRLASFIRMDMSSKEIAPLLRISIRSVENKRHRLRKKLDLKFGESLSEYLMRL